MNTFLFTWNPKRWDWTSLDADVTSYKANKHFDDRWSCDVTRKIASGDRAFLIRLGSAEPTGIMTSGYVLTEPFEEEHYSDPAHRRRPQRENAKSQLTIGNTCRGRVRLCHA